MPIAQVSLALLLPWLVGTLCLALILVPRRRSIGTLALVSGYGLFAGLQILFACIVLANAVMAAVNPVAVGTTLLLTALGLGALILRSKRDALPSPETARMTLSQRLCVTLFALLAGVHLLYSAWEVLHLPVFPWDAWSSWLYRAKVWFLNEQMVPIASPKEWRDGSDAIYNAIAHAYPGFLPSLSMWVALVLGYWNESLVNLPVLCCGLALSLALYGQCCIYGMSRLMSAFAAYALLSIPMVGAHMALAGYADLWMAGFTGLGLVALLQWLVHRDRSQLLIAILMMSLALVVKREGIVWLGSAAAIAALGALPRRLIAVALAVLLIGTLAAWLFGIHAIELPLLGTLGVVDGDLHLPLAGNFALERHALLDDYFDHFFVKGGWNLLWLMVLMALCALPLLPRSRVRRAVSSFFIVSIVAQLLLFQITDLGVWVESGTVVNRLPLHMTPALIFALLMVVHEFMLGVRKHEQPRINWRIALTGLLLPALVIALYLQVERPGEPAQTIKLSAGNLEVVVGSGRKAADGLTINEYSEGIAILSSGPQTIVTEDYGLLRLVTEGENTRQVSVFWRSSEHVENIFSVNVDRRGEEWIDLREHPEWRGLISEMGLVVYADELRQLRIIELELLPLSAAARWRKLRADWSRHNYWTQASVNAVNLGGEEAGISPALLAVCWVLGMAMAGVVFQRRGAAAVTVLVCALLAWLALDARWLWNRAAQAELTAATYKLLEATHLAFGDDERTEQLIDDVRSAVNAMEGADSSRAASQLPSLVIVAESDAMEFAQLRARYFALPLPAYAVRDAKRLGAVSRGDYLLVLREYPPAPGYQPRPANFWTRKVAREGRSARVVREDAGSVLLQLNDTSPRP